MDNSKVQTLNDFIRYGNTSTYSIPNSSFLRRFEDIVLLDKFAYDKYSKLIFGMSIFATLTDEELNVYKYRPDAISFKLYGTPNLSHLLLYLNRCSEYEFNKKRIRYITLENIQELFNLIMTHETDNMNKQNKLAVR